jgi:hypothetical protein
MTLANLMSLFWPLVLTVLSMLAVCGAKGVKWKLLNLVIIVACMFAGFAIGWGIGLWGTNIEIGAEVAMPLVNFFGIAAALDCWRRNKWREKRNVVPAVNS